ncbi:MAG: hypothetical protein ACTSVZ_05835 [Promethearchaeota archaeon]
MVANNPEIDTSKWELSDGQRDIIERLKIQCVYTQNRLLQEYYSKLLQTGTTNILELWAGRELWYYSGNYGDGRYQTKPSALIGGLPDGYQQITIDEINVEFP